MKNYREIADAVFERSEAVIKKRKERNKKVIASLVSVAVCLALIVAIPTVMKFSENPDETTGGLNDTKPVSDTPPFVESTVSSLEELNRPYKDISFVSPEIGYAWRWEERTVYEQYTFFEINGIKYSGRRREVGAGNIGEKVGSETLSGYASHPNDSPSGVHYREFDVFEIKNISSEKLLAVQMDGKYYAFLADSSTPPATFGDFLDDYGLIETLKLGRFTKKYSGEDDKYFRLNDDAYIWDVLNSCKEAASIGTGLWTSQNYISFTVTSDALGVYKHVMYVSEDGYLWTNAFDYAYLYNIGKDAAGKIISHALENSKEAKFEPYYNSIIGKVIEIADDYILVNDSVRCENPEDGISFKVMLDNLRISRYVISGVIGLNSTVRIEYEGGIDVENGYEIHGAFSAAEAIIAENGDVLIPE